jgi:hypothetical protein
MYLVNVILHFTARFAHVGRYKTPTTKEMSISMIEIDKEMTKFTNDVMFWIAELGTASQKRMIAILATILANNSSHS